MKKTPRIFLAGEKECIGNNQGLLLYLGQGSESSADS
jgi:hypothetical protein